MNIEQMDNRPETESLSQATGANSPSTTTSPSFSSSSEGPTDQGDAKPFNYEPSDQNDAIPFHENKEKNPSLPPGPIETLTDKDASIYNLDQGQGDRLAVIFNHFEYREDRLPTRCGTDQDVNAITECFKSMDFQVEMLQDPTVDEIIMKLFEVQKRQDLSIFALFILTHGEADGLLHAYDSSYRLHKTILPELLPDLCPGLAGRPKLIFIQACQGDKTDPGVLLKATNKGRVRHTSTDSSKASNNLPYCIPNFCDLLIFSAAYTGQFSFRSSKGSWFIQALCHEIQESEPEEDLISVLTKVSRNVALNKESNVPKIADLHKKKQVPLKQDTLIRKVYLKSNLASAIPPTTALKQTVNNAKAACNKTVTADEAFRRKDDNCLCM